MAQSAGDGDAKHRRLGDYVDSISAPDRVILETEFGGTEGRAWCRVCKRAWPVADLHLEWLPLFDQWGIVCPTSGCGRGLLADILPYDDLRSTMAPWWPVIPSAGERLELPATDDPDALPLPQRIGALLLAGQELEAIRTYRAANPEAGLDTAQHYVAHIKRELDKGLST